MSRPGQDIMDLGNKIFIVGVLVGEIEKEYPWSTLNKESLLYFKKYTGKTPEFLSMWTESLGDLLSQQKFKPKELMTAEMTNERNRIERRANIAEILRKPDTAMTAEDTKTIAARVIAEEVPGGSSSRSDPPKGAKVEGDVRKAVPKAAPAVIRKIAKAPPEPPRRSTPPIDPPAKKPKGAAERAPSGLRVGKGTGKRGEKGKFNDGHPEWYGAPEIRGFGHLPEPPPYVEPVRNEPQDVRAKSLFGKIRIGTSEKLTGRGANARLSGLTTHTLIGITMLGRVSLHILMRTTAIMREMVTTVRESAVAAAGGLPLSILPQKGWAGSGLGLRTDSLRMIGIDGTTIMGHRAGVSMTGAKMIGIDIMSNPRADVMNNTSVVGSAGDVPTLVSPFM